MKKLAMVGVLVGLGVLVILVAAPPQSPQINASFTLDENGQGVCSVVVPPDVMSGARRGSPLVWTITNQCGSGVQVSVGNFKHRNAGDAPKNPLVGQPQISVGSGASSDMRGAVRGDLSDNDLGTYKYDILINGAVALDPELIVD